VVSDLIGCFTLRSAGFLRHDVLQISKIGWQGHPSAMDSGRERAGPTGAHHKEQPQRDWGCKAGVNVRSAQRSATSRRPG
jgi:hypothetical protein